VAQIERVWKGFSLQCRGPSVRAGGCSFPHIPSRFPWKYRWDLTQLWEAEAAQSCRHVNHFIPVSDFAVIMLTAGTDIQIDNQICYDKCLMQQWCLFLLPDVNKSGCRAPNSFWYRAKCFRSVEYWKLASNVWSNLYDLSNSLTILLVWQKKKKKKKIIFKVHLLAFSRPFNHISWSSSAGVTGASDFSHIQEEIITPVSV